MTSYDGPAFLGENQQGVLCLKRAKLNRIIGVLCQSIKSPHLPARLLKNRIGHGRMMRHLHF